MIKLIQRENIFDPVRRGPCISACYIYGYVATRLLVASLETAGAIGGIGGVVVMIALMTAYPSWGMIVCGMIGLTIGFMLAFVGVIIINERNDRKKNKS